LAKLPDNQTIYAHEILTRSDRLNVLTEPFAVKRFRKERKMKKLAAIFFLLLVAGLALAQDLTQYELLNSTDIGIPKVLMDRWGAVSADIDNNGWPDIFSVKWRGKTIYSQIYLNNSGRYGNDIMANSPDLKAFEDTQNATRCNIFADYDNDGDKDFFYGGDYDMALFRNDNTVFTNVSQTSGVKGAGAPGFSPSMDLTAAPGPIMTWTVIWTSPSAKPITRTFSFFATMAELLRMSPSKPAWREKILWATPATAAPIAPGCSGSIMTWTATRTCPPAGCCSRTITVCLPRWRKPLDSNLIL